MPGVIHALHRLWDHHHTHHGDEHDRYWHPHPKDRPCVEGVMCKPHNFLQEISNFQELEEEARMGLKMQLFSIFPGQCVPGPYEKHHSQLVEQVLFKIIPHKRNSVQIQEIQYIVNPQMERAFDLKVEEVGGQVLYGFHGTREANIKNICRENFSLSRCKSLTQLGGAIWFSMDPLQSLLYVPDEKKSKKLILAKIITGNSFQGMCHHAYDECIRVQCNMFHTVIDGNVIIVMDDALILPCYIVSVSETNVREAA